MSEFRDLVAAAAVRQSFDGDNGLRAMLPNIKSPDQLAYLCGYGAALGLKPLAAPFQIHIVHGRPTLSASAIVGLVLQSPVCDYFECAETSDESATYVTKRKGGKSEQRLTFTLADARRAGLLSNNMWKKYPAEMLRARAGTALARMAYPDVLQGAYASEEFEGDREERPRVVNSERVSNAPPAVAAPGSVEDAEFTESDPLEGLSALMEAMGEKRWAAAQADWKRADVDGDKPPAAQLAWLQQWHDAQQAQSKRLFAMCRERGVEGERVKDGYHRWAAEAYPGRTRMREADASMLQRFITHLEETNGAIFQPEAA